MVSNVFSSAISVPNPRSKGAFNMRNTYPSKPFGSVDQWWIARLDLFVCFAWLFVISIRRTFSESIKPIRYDPSKSRPRRSLPHSPIG